MGNTAIVNELKGVPMAKPQINNTLALAVEKMQNPFSKVKYLPLYPVTDRVHPVNSAKPCIYLYYNLYF